MFLFQLRVVAFRQSNTAETTTAIVRVNVLRNPNAPVFPNQNLVFNLPEDQALGIEFGRINATDSDTVSWNTSHVKSLSEETVM